MPNFRRKNYFQNRGIIFQENKHLELNPGVPAVARITWSVEAGPACAACISSLNKINAIFYINFSLISFYLKYPPKNAFTKIKFFSIFRFFLFLKILIFVFF